MAGTDDRLPNLSAIVRILPMTARRIQLEGLPCVHSHLTLHTMLTLHALLTLRSILATTQLVPEHSLRWYAKVAAKT